MPSMDDQPSNAAHSAAFAGAFFGRDDRDGLAREIAALRSEIAALRAELVPVPSLILTGCAVIERFQRLHQG